ncbi:MAG TPA: methyltransferase domain-containing protein [Candidatus Woesebacteria bacterium]|nr:methyltransferase domain-containing protein [Candidatus Woesebacteria bacterium]HRS23241.1 methyltransferase domain-containing protein [Candidatus Woesebacteria bacterium]HRT39961.1 methyltransferase domain-containing protein [Candidatus Woesebacteria bacterium]
MMKVNLGCGPSGKTKGWLNYDWGLLPLLNKMGLLKVAISFGLIDKSYLVKWPKFHLVDIRKPLPLKDHSVDFIYCSHVLEHFEPAVIRKVLLECRRVLKNNGVLRIVVPDIKYIINNYAGAKRFNEFVYGYDKEKPYRFRNFIRGHQWLFDREELEEKLREAGFQTIKFTNIKKIDLPQYKGNSLFVEASN